ncbi:MAG: lysophospholipid acyltransferase family protein [Chloroflexia bacterium]
MPFLPRRRDKTLPFIPANKNILGEWLVTGVLLVPALKRAFGGVYVSVDPVSARLRADTSLPVIFCLTHSGWWDGHVAYLLNRQVFKRDSYLMMEDHQLARYFFFTWAGVFGVSRDDPRKAFASIEYITQILEQEPEVALWMFPQGRMVHPEMRPLGIYGGAANITRRLEKCALVPVAIRYEFILDQAPDVFARVGSPLLTTQEKILSAKDLTAKLDEAMTRTADELRADVASHSLRAYRRVLSGRGSINKLWDSVRKRSGKAKKPFAHD